MKSNSRVISISLLLFVSLLCTSFSGGANQPPYEPYDPDPMTGTYNVDVNQDISWSGGDPDGDPVTYDVYFGVDDFTLPLVSANQTETTYDPGTMEPFTVYKWIIVAWDDHDASRVGPTWDFRTEPGDNNPPYTPQCPHPYDEDTDVPLDQILSWTSGDPDGDPVTFDVYFGTSTSPPLVSANQSAMSYDPDLDADTTYYWRVVAWDSYDAHSSGALWMFTTGTGDGNHPPYEPSAPTPADEAVNISLHPILSWNGGDPDGDNVTYDIYFDTDASPGLLIANHTTTSYPLTGLSPDTLYYWQILARDNHSASTTGPLWRFTTGTNHPPNRPHTPMPANGSPAVNLTPVLSVKVVDPDNDVLDVWFYDAADDSLIGVVSEVNSSSRAEVVWSGLSYNTTYSWYAMVSDGYEINTSETWVFITKPAPVLPVNISWERGLGVHVVLSTTSSEELTVDWSLNITSKRGFLPIDEHFEGIAFVADEADTVVSLFPKGWGRVTVTLILESAPYQSIEIIRNGLLLRHRLLLFPSFDFIQSLE